MVNKRHQDNKNHETGLANEILPPATPMSRTPEYRREYQARYRARKKAEAAGLSLSPLSTPTLLSNNSGVVCLAGNKPTITSNSPVVLDKDATNEPSASTPGVVSLTGNKTTITSNSPVVVNENTTHQNNKYHEAGLVKELLPPATPMSRTPEYRREYQARYRARKKAEAAGLSLSPLSAPILLSNNSGLVCLTRNKSTITSTSPVVVDRDATGEPSASTPGNSHLPHIGAARSNLTDTVSVLDVNKGRLKYQREYRKRKKFDENSATEGMLKKRRETYALSVHGKDSTLTNNGEYQHERRSQSNNEMSPSIGAEQDLDQLKPDIYELGTNDDDGARVKSGHDVQYKSYRVEGHVGATGPDPYEHVFYKLPNSHHVLEKAANCTFCRAKRFTGEGPAFCCRKGKVLVHIPEAPAELRRLFTSQTDKDAIYFRKHIRHFNSHFSFTSLGASLDRCVSTAAGTGIYTFRVQGQVYHYLDQLVPGGSGPRHMQLYFYDTEDCVAHRISRSPNLDAGLIRKILDILRNNPYVHTFKSLGSVPNLDDYKIELNTEIGVDQRRYNAPTVSQVAAIWMDGSDPRHKFERSIMVYGQADRPFYIKAYHGCYDPLAYPLFFPCGEVGWNKKILYADGGSNEEVKNNHVAQESTGCNIVSGALEEDEDDVTESTKYVSPREYYCFKLQIRDGEFTMIDDTAVLETKWVRSYSPYQISISLKQIQEFLHMDKTMSHDLFNMGVRILATKEHQNMRSSNINITKHYMDLQFCKISEFGRHPNYRKKLDAKELSKTLKSWPSLYYDVPCCRYILMPYSIGDAYTLFILDQNQRALMMFDPKPILSCYQDIPYKRFVKKILDISYNIVPAMREVRQGWFEDLFHWKHIPIENIPVVDRCLSGDMVLQIMFTFNGTQQPKPLCTNWRELRKQFLINLLTYDGNKSQFLIPANIRDFLRRITEKNIGKTRV